jgi:hypothetical protein
MRADNIPQKRVVGLYKTSALRGVKPQLFCFAQ